MSTYNGFGAVGTIIYAVGSAAYKAYKTIDDTNRLKTDALNNSITADIDAREAREIADRIKAENDAKVKENMALLKKYLPMIAIVGIAAIAGLSMGRKK